MSDTKNLIDQIDSKVDKLLNRLQSADETIQSKTAEIAGLNDKLKLAENQIDNMKAEMKEIRESVPKESSPDTEGLKVRISELVKEIDDCILLLKA